MITTVLFDIDGVLIDSFNANFEFFRRLFTKAGYLPPTKEAYKDMFQLTMLGVIQNVTQSSNRQEIDRLMELGKQRSALYPYELIQTPQTLSTVIAALHRTYTLGLVTSRIRNGIFEIPQLAPLKQFFSVAVSFEDTKNHKPNPDPLLYALDQLHASPDETVYIGDQESDYLAARAARVKIIMLTKTTHPDADVSIKTFDDIPDAMSHFA